MKHQNEVRQLQERLTQEEESVIALREEGRLKEQQIAKLKKSLKEVIVNVIVCFWIETKSYSIAIVAYGYLHNDLT